MKMKNLKRCTVLAILAATAVWSGCTQKKVEPMTAAQIADGAIDPADWGKAYPVEWRRVVAGVEVDGQFRELVFLTNNLEWSAQTIADLCRSRWAIEVFFKQLKQTLQLADFLGNPANAVQWQVWTALLT